MQPHSPKTRAALTEALECVEGMMTPTGAYPVGLVRVKNLLTVALQEMEADATDDPGFEPPNTYVPGYGWMVM